MQPAPTARVQLAPTAPVQPSAPAAPAQPAPAAPAQQEAQGPVKLDLVPTGNDWTKVCGRDQAANKDICYTTRDFSAQSGQKPVLAFAVYDIKGDDTRIIRLLVPVGFMVRPGFRFAIDNARNMRGVLKSASPMDVSPKPRSTVR